MQLYPNNLEAYISFVLMANVFYRWGGSTGG